jgi:hypothetical protein
MPPNKSRKLNLASLVLEISAKRGSPVSRKDKLKLRRIMQQFAKAELSRSDKMRGFC